FTPTCNDTHFPGFMTKADELKAKGVDEILCMAVNDPFVMASWGKSLQAGDHIRLLSDGNGEYAAALGLTLDLSAIGLGTRSARFAAVVDDGEVTYLGVEPGKDVGVSSADAVLEHL
ncbi:MAG: peroxiredoxin, partial [Holophagales bacterium]|nr:peroxiredoxin [Holophagales bacterium]